MNCNLINGRCTHCGRRTLGGECSVQPAKRKKRLGDHTETLLSKLGVTSSRYKEIKRKFGLAPTCNCGKRKQWLNNVGKFLTEQEEV